MEVFGQDAIVLAKEFGYSEFSIAILEGDFMRAKMLDIDQYNNILSCVSQADKRTPLQYATEIIINWVFEDFIKNNILKSKQFKIISLGGDSEREFLHDRNVSGDSDFLIEYKRKHYKIELVLNHTLYWETKGQFELRNNKYKKLINEKCILLGIGTKIKKFFVINFQTPPASNYVPVHHYWNKPAYEIKFDASIPLYALDNDMVVEKIIEKL